MLWEEEIMKQNNYQYKHLLQDFTEDEILDGLELSLSDPANILCQKANADDQRRNNIIYRADVSIKMLYTSSNSAISDGSDQCMVMLDETHGELIQTRCKCKVFQQKNRKLQACRPGR